jgi:hypothetical protein
MFLDADWKSMQWTDGLAMFFEIIVELSRST